jgi:hypothetical protein
MARDLYGILYDFVEQLPVVSTHEHHLEDEDQSRLSLEGIFEHSYVGWLEVPVGETEEEHERFLQKVRYNSYFVWLEKALKNIFGFKGRITAKNWKEISEKIRSSHKEEQFHLQVLQTHCRYRVGLSDIYWNTGSDLGHPELFKPVVRSDMFVTCFHPDCRDHDDQSPWNFFSIEGLTFGEYIDYLEAFHRERVKHGAVAFKLATAYERSIEIYRGSFESAARVYMRDPSEVGDADMRAYGDFIINRICRLAAELNVPYQIHTGLGELSGSNPMALEGLIKRHLDTRFVLFHGGYPWIHEIGALAHNHSNVLVDLVWLPLISTTAAKTALHEYIEVVPSCDKLAWGSDSWTSEEAYGALLAFQHVVASVLSEKAAEGYITVEEAKNLAEMLLFRNASHIYRV